MNTSDHFEAVGCIVKKEKLGTFQHPIPLKDLVLETVSPFPGYYSAEPTEAVNRPSFLFLILKSVPGYNEDFVIRATQKIKREHLFTFDASPGFINLFNQQVPCIRLEMVNHDNLPLLLDLFARQGMSFAKHQEVAPYETIIRIKRYFSFQMLSEGILQNTLHREMTFLLIPDDLSWDRFESVTMHIKRNFHVGTFDAASGFYYDATGVRDFVRIFAPGMSLNDLKTLREKYLHELSR